MSIKRDTEPAALGSTPSNSDSPPVGRETVYVKLLDEGTDCWRPVSADAVDAEHFRLYGPIPDDELWEFQPGEVVRCVIREFSGGARALTAISRRNF